MVARAVSPPLHQRHFHGLALVRACNALRAHTQWLHLRLHSRVCQSASRAAAPTTPWEAASHQHAAMLQLPAQFPPPMVPGGGACSGSAAPTSCYAPASAAQGARLGARAACGAPTWRVCCCSGCHHAGTCSLVACTFREREPPHLLHPDLIRGDHRPQAARAQAALRAG